MTMVATRKRARECTHLPTVNSEIRPVVLGPRSTAILSAARGIAAVGEARTLIAARELALRAMHEAICFIVASVDDRARLYGLLGLADEYCMAFASGIDERGLREIVALQQAIASGSRSEQFTSDPARAYAAALNLAIS